MDKRAILEATLLRALCTKQLDLDEVLQILRNHQIIVDNWSDIESEFADQWVGASGGQIYIGESLAAVHGQMTSEHPDEKYYAEEVGVDIDV